MQAIVRLFLAAIVLCLSVASLAVTAKADPSNFPRLSLDPNVLLVEGGYANHPRDPGGRTLNGVIQRVYDADRAARGLPRRLLTPALLKDPTWPIERNSIYEQRYWRPCGGPELPRGLDFQVFTMCVNAGISRGWVMLMQVLGLPAVRPYAPMRDVLAAIDRARPREAIRRYGEARRRFYRQISPRTGGVFLSGWLSRETQERNVAFAMNSGVRTGASLIVGSSSLPMGKAVENADELLELIP